MQHIALIVPLHHINFRQLLLTRNWFRAIRSACSSPHCFALFESWQPKIKKISGTTRLSSELGALQTNSSCGDSSDDAGRIPTSSSKDVTDINTIEQDFDEWPSDFKSMLQVAPLEGIDLTGPGIWEEALTSSKSLGCQCHMQLLARPVCVMF